MRAPALLGLAGGLLVAAGTVSTYRTAVAADVSGGTGASTPFEVGALAGGLVLLVVALGLSVARARGTDEQRRERARLPVVLGALSIALAAWTLPGLALGVAAVATAVPQLRRSPGLARTGLALGLLGASASVAVAAVVLA